MKNLKILFSVLLVCIFILTGCGKKDKKKNTTKKEDTKFVVGDTLDIKLDSNPSTGYEWSYEMTGDDIIVIANRYEEDINCSELDGCSGKEIYTISSVGEGKVNLKFIYYRPESSDPYTLVADYEITIDNNLKISETHTGSYFEK